MGSATFPASLHSSIVTARRGMTRRGRCWQSARCVTSVNLWHWWLPKTWREPAAEAIEVEYEPLPAVTAAKDAIAPGAPQLFDSVPGNIVFDWDNDMGDAKAT